MTTPAPAASANAKPARKKVARWKSTGRLPKVKVVSEAEVERAAETLIINNALTERQLLLLKALRDHLALTEERLFILDGADSQYVTFGRALRLWRTTAYGLVSQVPPNLTSPDLRAVGLKPLIAGNQKVGHIWTLGPVGWSAVKKLWDTPFTTVGSTAHCVHHALAAEILFRFVESAKSGKGKTYEMRGPREAAVWTDAEKPAEGQKRKYYGPPLESEAASSQSLFMSADGMLLERKPDKSIGATFVLEYHNEERGGRAGDKIDAYDKLSQLPEVWRNAWGLDAFPKVLVVWRYPEVYRDYEISLREKAAPRKSAYAGAPWPLPQYRQISLADALTNPLGFKPFAGGASDDKSVPSSLCPEHWPAPTGVAKDITADGNWTVPLTQVFITGRKGLYEPPLSDKLHRAAVISISDMGGLPAPVKECRARLYLQFDDLTEQGQGGWGEPITPAQAQAIAAFVRALGDIETLVCQCEHGRSRSAAIAQAVCEVYGLPFENPVDERGFAQYSPNARVLAEMRTALQSTGRG